MKVISVYELAAQEGDQILQDNPGFRGALLSMIRVDSAEKEEKAKLEKPRTSQWERWFNSMREVVEPVYAKSAELGESVNRMAGGAYEAAVAQEVTRLISEGYKIVMNKNGGISFPDTFKQYDALCRRTIKFDFKLEAFAIGEDGEFKFRSKNSFAKLGRDQEEKAEEDERTRVREELMASGILSSIEDAKKPKSEEAKPEGEVKPADAGNGPKVEVPEGIPDNVAAALDNLFETVSILCTQQRTSKSGNPQVGSDIALNILKVAQTSLTNELKAKFNLSLSKLANAG